MDIELTGVQKLDHPDTNRPPPETRDTDKGSPGTSNQAYVPDGEELRHRKVSIN